MKFLDISSFYSERGGGVRTYHNEKIRFFEASERYEYVMIVPSPRYTFERRGKTRIYGVRGFPVSADGVYRQLFDVVTMKAILHNERPDVVEVGSCYLDNWLALAGALTRRPIMSGFYHADFPDSYMALAARRLPGPFARGFVRFWQRYARFSYSRLDVTLVASRYIRDKLAGYGLRNTRLTPLGVDVDVFRPERSSPSIRRRFGVGPRGRLVLYVGRFSPEKGMDALVTGLPLLLEGSEDRVVLVGDGPLKADVTRAAGDDPRIRFVDFVRDRGELAGLMASADVFLSPGPHETFGLGALEAMSSGTPVVAAASGGVMELVSASGGGVLFEPSDGASMASAVRVLLDNELGARAGAMGRRFAVERHAWPVVLERMIEIYHEVSEDRPRIARAS